ncbi:protein kinase family protein [Hyalangium gracile]|uniref:hypothetical protein n=1 Tax=Hyalangium gracile TaxID=394092 RepID=UPI001CD02844|nr:hypothetical protein [Hyalangium gracile]
MASKKVSPYAKRLAGLAKTIAKAKPEKLHPLLFDAFVVVAATGDAKRAARVLDWMYGRVPAPTQVAHVLSTQAIDGFCAAAGLGDRTKGLPAQGKVTGSLAERVKRAELQVRERVTANAYDGNPPKDDAWEKKEEPWRTIDRWRRIQTLAAAKKEQDALTRLVGYLADLDSKANGAGYGDELVLGLDLALRNGGEQYIPGWLDRHGHRFASSPGLLLGMFCLPAVATAVAKGLLTGTIGLSTRELDEALDAIEEALEKVMKPARTAPKPAAKVQRRRVSAEYSQVQLEPAELNSQEQKQVHFQKKSDHTRGMSLFPTMVGIATPPETVYVDAEITVVDGARNSVDPKDAVQAVAFPLNVRGPLLLRSATGTEDDPFVIPNGDYDVLASFFEKKAPRASAGMRVFRLELSFHPAKSLGAPKTLRLEG